MLIVPATPNARCYEHGLKLALCSALCVQVHSMVYMCNHPKL